MALTAAQKRNAEKNKKYWADREEEQLKHYITEETEYDKQIKKIYTNMLDGVQEQIDGFYGRYAKKEGITIAEAKKRVSQLEIERYERKAKQYVKEKNFSAEANEEMRLYNLTMKVNRLELLKANVGIELIAGHDELQKFMDKILQGRTEEELKRQAGILGKTITNNAQKAHAIVNSSFHNATFSNRIWMYHDLLRGDLDKLLQTALIQGKNPRAVASELRKHLIGDKHGKGATYNIERLMRTELARVQTEAQKQSFERNGFEEYVFIVNGGCCPICEEVAKKNSGVYKVKMMMPGRNAPPMHPHCRCSTAAHSSRADYDAWLNYLEQGGTTAKWNTLDEKEKLKFAGNGNGSKEPTYEELKQQIDDERKRLSDMSNEDYELDDKIREYERKNKQFSEFEGLKKDELSRKLKVINNELVGLEEINDRWYNRPERGTDEYTAWCEWKRSIDFDSMQSRMYKLLDEKSGIINKLDRWDDYEAWKKWKKENPVDGLNSRKATLADEMAALETKIADMEKQIIGKRMVEGLKKKGVTYREVSKHSKALTADKIISELAGGDLTQGSCASVGLAYCGQKCGLNVLDFRDGDSRNFFSTRGNLKELSKMQGLKTYYKTARSSVTAGNQLLKQTEVGKEYYLVSGRHAAIVRRTDDGKLQYLELQSAYRSGWTDFDGNPRYTLKQRFGETKAFGSLDDESFMIEVDSFKDCKDFQELLGYINTADDKQRKGSYGTIK